MESLAQLVSLANAGTPMKVGSDFLADVLTSGDLPEFYRAHIERIFNHAAPEVIEAAVNEVAAARSASRTMIWRHLLSWTRKMDAGPRSMRGRP